MSKDKRLPMNKVQSLLNLAYDHMEDISLETSKEVLMGEFNFTQEQFDGFKEKYLELFGEKAANYIVSTRQFVTKKLNK